GLLIREFSRANRRIPIFAAHGTDDDVVSLALGQQAAEIVRQLGIEPEWRTYDLPHSVSIEEVADIGTWLRSVWAQKAY
ncbi:MAG: carboxylesterase, partial [Proteobacteria bacterium]|nr:carboxylesterase [Pseudomonadota bacterium]